MTQAKPILFSAPMVRAILDGRKTMTRRRLKTPSSHNHFTGIYGPGLTAVFSEGPGFINNDHKIRLLCVGDTLWVRETAWICPPGWTDTPINPRGPNRQEVAYKADDRKGGTSEAARDYNLKLTPSIFMPRWASRITLRVTAVKVERLQDITPDDACEEGVRCDISARTFVDHFKILWESINGPGSWAANPFVAAYTFERIDGADNA